jgi:hypothetical protein
MRLVEHALAAQCQVWGSASNLIVPPGWDLRENELFYRLVRLFDPDIAAIHIPTHGDLAAVAPEERDRMLERVSAEREELGIDENTRNRELEQLETEPVFHDTLDEHLQDVLIEAVGPLRHRAEAQLVHVDGNTPAPYPLSDVAKLDPLPASVLDVTTELDDLSRLMLAHRVGRLTPQLRTALRERKVQLNEVKIEREYDLMNLVWPKGRVAEDFLTPAALPSIDGLARRFFTGAPSGVVVVAGDAPQDFLLFHGLTRLRPSVFWLPASKLESDLFVDWIADAVRSEQRHDPDLTDIAVVTAESDDAAAQVVEALNERFAGQQLTALVGDWRNALPRVAPFQADAKSTRRTPLLRHDGETQELPTPIPVSVTSEDPYALNWMVDVEIDGWTSLRHRNLASTTFRGAFSSTRDARCSAIGPSYFGLSAFRQAFLGLEGSTARPRLSPSPILDQLASILYQEGWQIRLSDKGMYAQNSARLFGGVDELAAALRSGTQRELLDAFLVPKNKRDALGRFVTGTQRRYLTLDHVTTIAGSGERAGRLITDLTERGSLLRGHLLKCEHCRGTSFYRLSEHQEFTCTRCSTTQGASPFSWVGGNVEPQFHYALNEVLYQFLTHNGDLPLLAALDFFGQRGDDRAPFDVAFEVEVISPNGQKSEHDIAASWGNELWLGEATKDSRFETTNEKEAGRFARLAEVALLVSADGVLIHGPNLEPNTRARLSAAFRSWKPRLELLPRT